MNAPTNLTITTVQPRGRRAADGTPNLAAASARGVTHTVNQDRVRVLWVEDAAVIVMADGVGGMPYGGEAAEAATNHAVGRLRRELPRVLGAGAEAVRTLLLSTIWSAGTELARLGHALGLKRLEDGLATTLILAVALDAAYVVVWIGDGGAFVLRGPQAMEGLLKPHKSPDAPTLLEAVLGPESDGTPSSRVATRRPGDVLVVSTDGIADLMAVAHTHLIAALRRAKGNAVVAARACLSSVATVRDPHERPLFRDDLTVALLLTAGTPTEHTPRAIRGQPVASSGARAPGAAAEGSRPPKVA